MKTNTLALLSAVSLSVLLAACGGGGSSTATTSTGTTTADVGSTSTPSTNTGVADTGIATGTTGTTGTGTSTDSSSGTPDQPAAHPPGLPASWAGSYIFTSTCEPSFSKSGGGTYYGDGTLLTVDVKAQTIAGKDIQYSDDQCTQKAGAIVTTISLQQLQSPTVESYQDVQTGVSTVISQTSGDDGSGVGFFPAAAPTDHTGIQRKFTAGLNSKGSLCLADSRTNTTDDLSTADCAIRDDGNFSKPVDTGAAVPAFWSGKWVAPMACHRTYDRRSDSGYGSYYENQANLTFNSTDNTVSVEDILYSDNQCTSKAGSIRYVADTSQLQQVTQEGYVIARRGTLTETTATSDSSLDLKSPVTAGSPSILAGIKPNGTLCVTPVNPSGTGTQTICYTKQ
ncbi:hypothetical protein [Amphibiibacter pelophylacis]|uniref:Uncharacterized protein n=1 Tax=Amphibiibacter pelophylacis TaxID=1799477 RepID=A0ACC6P527_9BURK